MNRLVFPSFCLALLFWGCGEKLPKPTQNGSNTFGCKINGKKWVPNGGGFLSGIKPIEGGFTQLYNSSKGIGISIRAYASNGESVQIFLNNIVAQVYDLNENTIYSGSFNDPKSYGLVEISSGQRYMTSSTNLGKVIINKADTSTGIISGQFYFKAGAININSQPNGTGTVNITEGVFDIKSPL